MLCYIIIIISFQVSEMAVSELPGNPNAVWTVKKNVDGNFIQILFIL